MRLRPAQVPPDEPTPMPEEIRLPDPADVGTEYETDADLFGRLEFAAKVLAGSLLMLASIALTVFAWAGVFGGK